MTKHGNPLMVFELDGSPMLGSHFSCTKRRTPTKGHLRDQTAAREWTLRLAMLDPAETSLNAGRFAMYTPVTQENRTFIHKRKLTEEGLSEWYADVLRWIARCVNSPWSAMVAMSDVSNGQFEFSFQNRTESVMFHLCFGH